MVTLSAESTAYLDTNALIYLTEGTAAFKTNLEAFLQDALVARARLVTSELAITEVLVAPLRDQDKALIAAYDELFESLVVAVPIDRRILVRAAQLRADTTRLRTPDAIHLATAERLDAEVFVTGDAGIVVNAPMVSHLLTDHRPK